LTRGDDLGRVVIPKEIRRTMRIREGDPLEIYTDREGEVIFKKYSPIGELTNFSTQYAETLHKVCELSVIITDRDSVIAVSGLPKKEYMDKTLSLELEKIIENRSVYVYSAGGEKILATNDGRDNHYVSCAMPIITEGDIIGCVVSMLPIDSDKSDNSEVETKLVQTAANFLSKQLES